MKRVVRIGTRGSPLALAQARDIRRRLAGRHPKTRFQIVVVSTVGDEFQSVEIFKKTNIGVFTKAIEDKLLRGQIDIAVHSLKDLPTELPRGLTLAAFPARERPNDVLVTKRRLSIDALPFGAMVGTGSPRRKRQIARLRPDLRIVDIRGNLDTRIRRVVRDGKYDAVVVAEAGLRRLKKYMRYARPISADKFLPAVGQAVLGIEIRSNDREVLRMVKALNHRGTEIEALAERRFLKTLHGGCRGPVGIRSTIKNGQLRLKGAVFSVSSPEYLEGEIKGPVSRYLALASRLAKKLLAMGADKFLSEARRV